MFEFKSNLSKELSEIKAKNLYKNERILEGPQGAEITVGGKTVINFCANNYLGLANHPRVIAAAKRTLDDWGYGLSSVRFICGTQEIHKQLEEKITGFLETEDTILYSSCFDANAGIFESLLTKEDVIISDELNHASIIDGIRLSKAERKIFKHMDMADLEEQLKASKDFRRRLVVTDGVFSMDGDIADLKSICDLTDKYKALVMVDDSHATGFIGEKGKGTHEHNNVLGRIDIITSTLGKALGGAMGGFTSGRKEIVDYLRQRSRPYLFSNSLAPVVVGTAIAIIDMLESQSEQREKLRDNTAYFRDKITKIGLDVRDGTHPIVPVMLYDAKIAQDMASGLLEEGIYVIGFFYPVVPEGKARIRVQISAAHTKEHLDHAIAAFEKVGKKTGAI
ncbi:MAG: glycine C-acetyltransferase [Candidatus Kerfeldbacteria bacterium CG08_land_8_20_14_0_20_42_7]|uniref:2-amino-3-ketobutyrate coenzyme A ligase n=1 Tax=Candidatus Kerfeldbacteria bacterium CG08_land_8_20_14_0_20_42_7 TaxID=2014245 RepID=A0A2H0YUU1_9BACT|nr:MAG: glycine C-acetyltransferase [Candidatus Kerfeldbacteria bacterium CG08_land_8_20_14_0_20_42_7]